MEDLFAIATRFRRAIEETGRGNLPAQFRDFPAGTCGDTSLLLGFYLKQQGARAWDYVSGMRGEFSRRHSHAWIQQGDNSQWYAGAQLEGRDDRHTYSCSPKGTP